MPTARDSVRAAVVGQVVYVVGGFGGSRLPTVEAYNTATDSWSPAAPLKVGKSLAAVGAFGSTLIAAGGLSNSGVTDDTEGNNTKKDVWKALSAMPTARQGACAGRIGDKFYVAGGDSAAFPPTPLDVLEAYDRLAKNWAALADISLAVISSASAVAGGRLYCFGGTDDGRLFQGTVYDNTQIYQP
jgi:N-acetylneuraminic acid mutarotase